jgi:hypothetical protein
MSSIKFNSTTKEIELIGSESFIDSNFYRVHDLMTESFEITKTETSRKLMADKEQVSLDKNNKSTNCEEIPNAKVSEAPRTTETVIHNAHQGPEVKRPPVRKYFNTLGKLIKSEDTVIYTSQVVEPTRQAPQGISIVSLKEKFGLSKQQIEGLIRDAEKQGRARRDLDGSYVWE